MGGEQTTSEGTQSPIGFLPQSFLGQIRLHLRSSEIPVQMGRPFRWAPAAYGFLLRFGEFGKERWKGVFVRLLCVGRSHGTSCLSTNCYFHFTEKETRLAEVRLRGGAKVRALPPLRCPPRPSSASPWHAMQTQVTTALDPFHQWYSGELTWFHQRKRSCFSEGSGRKIARPVVTLTLGEASQVTWRPHHCLSFPVSGLAVSQDLRAASLSSGCSGDWLPAFTAQRSPAGAPFGRSRARPLRAGPASGPPAHPP